MDDLLPNPFQPSPGDEPPYRAGHDLAARYLTLALEQVRGGGSGDVFLLYGPRRFGKTALLREFERKACCKKIRVAAFRAPGFAVASPHPLSSLEVCGDGLQKRRGNKIISAWESDSQSGTTEGETAATLRKMLGSGPLLLTLDDAHNIPIQSLETLSMSAKQCIDKDLPLLVVLTGSHLLHAHRLTKRLITREYQIGRLDDELIREALAIPARIAGRKMDPDALEMLTSECVGFPFFAQILGKAVWDIDLQRTSRCTAITEREAVAGIDEARREVLAFCEDSLRELTDAGVLKAAVEVCHLFASKTGMSESEIYEKLQGVCEATGMSWDETIARLLDFSIIGRVGLGFVPGIPRLCDFIAGRHAQSADGCDR